MIDAPSLAEPLVLEMATERRSSWARIPRVRLDPRAHQRAFLSEAGEDQLRQLPPWR